MITKSAHSLIPTIQKVNMLITVFDQTLKGNEYNNIYARGKELKVIYACAI